MSRTHALPNAITYINTCITYLKTVTRLSAPYLNTCIDYLITLSRLSAPYLKTLPTRLGNTLGGQPELSITSLESSANHNREPINFVSQSESNTQEPSAANQNRVLSHPSRQPIRIEHYVTRELSARVGDPSRLAIAYFNT